MPQDNNRRQSNPLAEEPDEAAVAATEAEEESLTDILDEEAKNAPQEPAAPARRAPQSEPRSEAASRLEREVADFTRMDERNARQEAASSIGIFDHAVRYKDILRGRIDGVETNDGKVYWVSYNRAVTVLIPFEQAYMAPPEELLGNTPDILRRQRQFLTKSLGAEISFVVTSFQADPEKDDFVAIASRTEALALERRRYFGANAPRKVSVGCDVVTQILNFGPHAAYVTACGMDIRVRNDTLSLRHISDIGGAYEVGQKLLMRVVRLEEKPGKLPEMVLSARPIELKKYQPNLKRIRGQHPRYAGTVTSVRLERNRERPSVLVNLFLDGIEVPAFSRTFELHVRDDLHTGDRVYFEVLGVTGNGFAHGRIIAAPKPR